MRRAFAETLAEIGRRDPRIVLLTADLGFMALEPFADACPQQFFNVGVAEQNMIGVATGMAEAGFIPYTYSIVPFAVLRPFEFIRNGPIAHQFPVRIVSVGGGLEYGHNGISHYGIEDVGVLRTQPAITLICPCDPAQARAAVMATWDRPGPIYYRLGKDDRAVTPGLDGRFELGRADVLHEGSDLLIVSLGAAANDAVAAAKSLHGRGIGVTVLAVSSFQPSPTQDLVAQLRKFSVVMTVEAHYITGALGSWVSEVIAEQRINCRVVRCGVRTMPDSTTGSQTYMHQIHGISGEKLAETAIEALKS